MLINQLMVLAMVLSLGLMAIIIYFIANKQMKEELKEKKRKKLSRV